MKFFIFICNNFYILYFWLIPHSSVILFKFWMHGIYINKHICKHMCSIYICQFKLVALGWLWCNTGGDFGIVAPHMDSLHLEQVERPTWGARLHPWTEQQISPFSVPSIPQGGGECQHTHSSLSGGVCQLDLLHHAGIGRSLCFSVLQYSESAMQI
jgi:hypothetical protein